MNKNKGLLFIPVYNCEKQIVRVIESLNEFNTAYFDECIIINNIGDDKTESEAITAIKRQNLRLKFKILRNHENISLGGSHKVAFDYLKNNNSDFLVVLHGDDQGNINDITECLNKQQYEEYDNILGARFMDNSNLINYSKFRVWGNKIFNLIASFCLGFKVFDLGSGLNCYNKSFTNSCPYIKFSNNSTFNVYLLLYASLSKSRIKFIPITWKEEDQTSNAKLFSQSLEILFILIEYFFKYRKILPQKGQMINKIDLNSKVIFES